MPFSIKKLEDGSFGVYNKTKKEMTKRSFKTKEAAERMGYNEIISKAGGSIVADTCMVVSPIEKMGYKTTGVNSGKAANYLPGFCKQEVCFANIDDLVEGQI